MFAQLLPAWTQPNALASQILRNQALHAREVRFHWRGRDWLFEAEPEDAFCDFIETVELVESE